MSTQQSRKLRLEEALKKEFLPSLLVVENESSSHNVPKGSETHFKVVMVSDKFKELSRVERSQKVHSVLQEELKTGLHALSLRLLTPEEWQNAPDRAQYQSPPCMGGEK